MRATWGLVLALGLIGCERRAAPLPSDEVRVQPGSYAIGSPADETCRRKTDRAREQVKLGAPFAIDKHEMTQARFRFLRGYAPSWQKCEDCPVDSVTHDEAEAACNARSKKAGLKACYRCSGDGPDVRCRPVAEACDGYRLPTETEWEIAARAGDERPIVGGTVKTCMGKDEAADAMAWTKASSSGSSHPVGTKRANAWGIHDAGGNVWEWTSAVDGVRHIARGGSWFHNAEHARSAARRAFRSDARRSYVGLRCARSLTPAVPAPDTAPIASAKPAPKTPGGLVASIHYTSGHAKLADPECAKDDDNCALMSLVQKAAGKGAKLVVLPEYALDQENPEPTPKRGTKCTSPVLKQFGDVASALRIHLVADLETKREGHEFNTQVAWGPDGTVVATHDKFELYAAERGDMTPGKSVTTFDTPVGRVGLLVCADIYGDPIKHAELVEKQGARIIAFSNMWTVDRATRWPAAFARDWNVFVVSANGSDGDGHGSGVFDPKGRALVIDETDNPRVLLTRIPAH